jgi:hypothetical protein
METRISLDPTKKQSKEKKISKRFFTFKKVSYLCETKAEMLTFFDLPAMRDSLKSEY